eukprot:Skav213899  [mRNA]  locus=scaffold1439:33763:44892:+ [translate_table: standard]
MLGGSSWHPVTFVDSQCSKGSCSDLLQLERVKPCCQTSGYLLQVSLTILRVLATWQRTSSFCADQVVSWCSFLLQAPIVMWFFTALYYIYKVIPKQELLVIYGTDPQDCLSDEVEDGVFCASIAAVECFRRTGGDKLLLCLQDVAEKKKLREGVLAFHGAFSTFSAFRAVIGCRAAKETVAKDKDEEESEEPDFGGSDSDVSDPKAKPVKKDKEALRQEVGLANGLPTQEPTKRNAGSALEAMRRGFKTRSETRVEAKGKEARRLQAEALVEGPCSCEEEEERQDRVRELRSKA